jgi:hypothetical protein
VRTCTTPRWPTLLQVGHLRSSGAIAVHPISPQCPEPNTAALLLAGAGSSASDFAGARLAFLTRSFHRIWGKGEERWPCKSTCAPLLDRNYSETPVFHSLRRGDESRAEKLREAYGIVVR